MSRLSTRFRIVLVTLVVLTAAPGLARALDDPAAIRGVEFLRRQAGSLGVGESALAALALMKAEVPATDPAVANCLAKIRKRFTSVGYDPELKGGHDVYEAGVVALALANLD